MIVKLQGRIATLSIIMCALLSTNAQVTGELNVLDTDLFYIQYLQENEISEGLKYQKGSVRFNVPLIRKEKFSVFSSIGFDSHDFRFDAIEGLSSTNEFERFYNANISNFINYKLSDKWSLNALISSFLISDFSGGISMDNLNINANAFAERTFVRDNGGYFQLGFGIGYMTLNGTTQVNPIVQLKAKLNEKWSFVIGLPNTYVKWDFHQKHSLKLLGDLNDFTSKLNNDNLLLNDSDSDELVFTTVAAGLEYNYWFTDTFGVLVKGTFPVWGNYEIRDNDGNTSFDFDASFDQPFLSIGLKFNPRRAVQNRLKPY